MEANLSESISLQQEAANESTSCDRLFELATSTNLARLVAKNPSAPPELLQELSNSSDAITRENVAANPNTPTEVLLKLGTEFPEQLLDNPVFSLLLLENPNLVEQMPLTTLLSILKLKRVPVSFLEWAAGHSNWDVLLAVAQNPHTPQSALERMVEGTQVSWLGQYIAQHSNTPGGTLSKLARDKNPKVRLAVAGHSNTPGDVLDWLTEDLNMSSAVRLHQELGFIRRIVAQNPNTPERTLQRLAADQMELMNLGRDIRKAVAENPNTPLSALEKLVQDQHSDVREPVAMHPKITERLLIQMKIAPDEQAARNLWHAKLTTNANILEQLAEHEWYAVRLAVAKNPNTPGNVLDKILRRGGGGGLIMWELIAQHPNTPTSVLEEMMIHPNTYLRHLAAKNPNVQKTRVQG